MIPAYPASLRPEQQISRKTLCGIVAATAFNVVVAGCGNSSTGTRPGYPQTSTQTAAASDPSATVLVSDPTDASMAALGGGKISVIGGCLGAGGSVIIWPPGTTVVVDPPLRISIPGDGEYSVGDTAPLGGGYVADPTDSGTQPLRSGGVEVPTSCLSQGVFLAGPAVPTPAA